MVPRSCRRVRTAAVGLVAVLTVPALAACIGSPSAAAPAVGSPSGPAVSIAAVEAADRAAVLSPLAFQVLDAPQPVTGSDGKRHYAYEVTVRNQSTGTATLTSVQPMDGSSKQPIGAAVSGSALSGLLRVIGAASDQPVLAPGGSATLFLDVVQPATDPVASSLVHAVSLSFRPADRSPDRTIGFTGIATPVTDRAPVVVSPPLRGERWVVGNGCCNPVNAHRGSTLSIDGTIRVAQRFAIDFVQLTQSGAAVTGDPSALTSYPAFGQQVHAAAAGTVVITHDGEQEETPGALPPGKTLQTADGNYVVADIGNGLYAFYAHMQPGSLKVKPGDQVKVGDVLGLLGNTGNTDAPHLHFHVMDSPSPLRSNGVPFVFDTFVGSGGVSDLDLVIDPKPGVTIPVDTSLHGGAHQDEMPLGRDLIGFRG